MIGLDLANCKGCAERRAMMQRWMQAWQEWAKNPLGPRPGTEEWLKAHPEINQHADETNQG